MSLIHVEGMGVVGSLLAWQLEARGVAWSWSDNESKVNAWSASTGSIFATGEASDMACMEVWDSWRRRAPWAKHLAHCVEEAAWWYSTKAAPHGSKLKHVSEFRGLRRGPKNSLHFNSQLFVPETRKLLASRRELAPPKGARVIVSHGFGSRLSHYVWGWARLVRIEGLEQNSLRPCVYLRKGKFVMAYAYPVPNTPYWYAGSSLISQQTPKDLTVLDKYARWKTNFEELSGGAVQVVEESEFLTGWRPVPLSDREPLLKLSQDGSVLVRPQGHSGVRKSPAIVSAVLREVL
jgi:hypothetical protein